MPKRQKSDKAAVRKVKKQRDPLKEGAAILAAAGQPASGSRSPEGLAALFADEAESRERPSQRTRGGLVAPTRQPVAAWAVAES